MSLDIDLEMILSVAQVAALGEIPTPDPVAKHYFDQLLYNPDGSRFITRPRLGRDERLLGIGTAHADRSRQLRLWNGEPGP